MVRQVIEDPEFTRQLQLLGNIQFLDERLAAVHLQATYDAEDLPAISDRLRVVRVPGLKVAPILRVFIELSDTEAILRWIEPVPDPGSETIAP